MKSGIINLLIGGLLFAAGASGRFALIGTHSTTALAAIGAAVAAYGIFQLIRSSAQRRG
jgi:predicted phage tail protein